MAQQILHGHFSAFYWGQDYGGVEPYFVAAVFAVFGQSAFALTVSASLLSGVAAILIWRIGVRIVPASAAVSAAVLSWVWPECTVWNSTREFGFRQATLILGLCVLLQCLRIAQRPRDAMDSRYGDWVILGLAVGVGWWSSPEIVYFLLPGAVIIFGQDEGRRVARPAKKLAAAACGAAVGAAPWLVASFDDGWGTLQRPIGSSIPGNTYGYRLGVFFSHVLPMILGLRVEGSGAWLGSPLAGKALYAAALVGIALALFVVSVFRRQARFVVVFCVTFPFLYAVFPSAWFWNDGRYAIYLPPLLALAVVGAIWELTSTRTARAVVIGILTLTVVSSIVSFNDGFGALSSGKLLKGWHSNPNPSVTALASTLVHDGVHSVYGSYWVAYDLQYLSGDRVTGFALDNVRIPANEKDVERDDRVAWVFVPTSQLVLAADQLGMVTDLTRASGHSIRSRPGWMRRVSRLRRRRSIHSWWCDLDETCIHRGCERPTQGSTPARTLPAAVGRGGGGGLKVPSTTVAPMARRSSLRSQLYRAARDVGNVQAASKGPGSYAKRIVRRKVYRTTNGLTHTLLREFGL